MKSRLKLPVRNFYYILIPCALIILSESFATMIKVKDINLYNEWVSGLDIGLNNSFNDYIVMNLIFYFFKIIIPISLSLNAYLAYIKIFINQLFIFVWTVLILGGLAYTIIEFNLNSIFYYITIIGYIALFLALLSISMLLNKNK